MQWSYATQSAVTEPGVYHGLLDGLPSHSADVARVVQGLVYHYSSGKSFFGYEPPKERIPEIDTRTLEQMLKCIVALDKRPLHEPRAYARRLIGCCRDFSLIACAILRRHHIPARLRYGFGAYFHEGYWEDHVIVEVWTGSRWQQFDPQLAGVLRTEVDLFDLPPGAFITGGRAWQLCRNEGADPARFGLGPYVPEVSGWWVIRGRLLLDIAALHKTELLCWDEWSYGDEHIELTQEEEQQLDRIAHLSLQSAFEELTALWHADKRLGVPPEVNCFSPAVGPHPVKL